MRKKGNSSGRSQSERDQRTTVVELLNRGRINEWQHFFEVEVVEVATQFRWNSFNVPNRKFATWKADRILTLAFNLSSKISSRCLINYIQQPFGHPEFCIANLVPLDLWSFWIKDSPRSRSFQQWETPEVFMPWSPCWYTEWFGESRADITKIH